MSNTNKIQFQSDYLTRIGICDEITTVLKKTFEAIDPINVVKNLVQCDGKKISIHDVDISLRNDRRLMVWGMGKAAQSMAIGLKNGISPKTIEGVVITKHSFPHYEKDLLPEVISFEGDHPVPSYKSVHATQRALEIAGRFNEGDTVICLISGGGSALCVLPQTGITLEDYQAVTKQLLECGANIQEINSIRQQIDKIKGGGLARLLYPANIVSLILSDVVGDPLDIIASGPTFCSGNSMDEVWEVIGKYDLVTRLPKRVMNLLQSEKEPEGVNKSRENEDKNRSVKNILAGNNQLAARTARNTAASLGFNAKVITSELQGEAQDVGKDIAKEIIRYQQVIKQTGGKQCIIYGGETTVTIRGKGKGGRNQEVALAAAKELSGWEHICLISIATDGEDGPTDAAGAVVDGRTIDAGHQKGMDAGNYLKNNDAYTYFESIGALIKTGPSRTNVNDLILAFIY